MQPHSKKKPKLVQEIAGPTQWQADVLGSSSQQPVCVDFWAPWCAPCRLMAPIFEEAAEIYRNSVKFVKVNTQANPQIMEQLNIRSIPTLVVFYRGEVFDVKVGVTPKPVLQKMIRRVLDKHEGVGLVDKVRRLWRKEKTDPGGKGGLD